MDKYDVFVSYSKKDGPFADSLVKALDGEGVKVWHDRGVMRFGDSFMHNIEDALEQSRYFLLIISPDYLSSQWTSFEMGVALSRDASSNGGHLLPVFVRNARDLPLPNTIRKYRGFDAEEKPVYELATEIADIVRKGDNTRAG